MNQMSEDNRSRLKIEGRESRVFPEVMTLFVFRSIIY